jgi:hypothetical protein
MKVSSRDLKKAKLVHELIMTVTAVNNLSSTTDPAGRETLLRQKATEFVNQVFYGTLMREFRNAQQPTMFDGGPGGTAFIRQLDMELISRISQRGDSSLADALLRQLGGARAGAGNGVSHERDTGRVENG